MNTLKIVAANSIVLEYSVYDKEEAYNIIAEVLENETLADYNHEDIEVYYNGVKAEDEYYDFNLID